MSSVSAIDSEETVVRILHRDWVVDEELQITAFSLRHNETYISVNRPIIDSFGEDIADFLAKHPDYYQGWSAKRNTPRRKDHFTRSSNFSESTA